MKVKAYKINKTYIPAKHYQVCINYIESLQVLEIIFRGQISLKFFKDSLNEKSEKYYERQVADFLDDKTKALFDFQSGWECVRI